MQEFFNTGLYKIFEPKYKDIVGKPFITVSAKGISNGLSNIPNDGADFGPDTTLNATSPSQTGAPYSSTIGIQEAANYVKTKYGGGKVILKAGNYNVAPISIPSGVDLEGENITIHDGGTPYVTSITAISGTSSDNLITFSGDGGSVTNLYFLSNVSLNSLLYYEGSECEIANNTFNGNNVAKTIDVYPNDVRIYDNFFVGSPSIAHIYVEPNGNDIWIENNFISQEGGTNSTTNAGIYVNGNTPGLGVVNNNDITGMGISVLLTGSGVMTAWKFAENNFDTARSYGLQIIPNGGNLSIEEFMFIGNLFDFAGINNINIQSSSSGNLTLVDVKFSNNLIYTASQDGIYISAYSSTYPILLRSSGLSFIGDVISTNSYGNSNLYSNVYIAGSISGEGIAAPISFIDVINTNSGTFNGTRYTEYGYSIVNLTGTSVVNIIGGGIWFPLTSYIDSITSAIGILKNVNIVNINDNLVYLTPTTPSVPASGTAQQNTNPYPVNVYLYGGTVTEIQLTRNGTAYTVFSNASGLALSGQVYKLNPSDSITITYTTAPTWNWLSD